MSRNNVRGPTSALTEFLRASNITPTTVARRAAIQPQPVAGPSNAAESNQNDDESDLPRRGARRSRRGAESGYASDELDEPEAPATKKQKTARKSASETKAKKKASKTDKDEDEDEDEDPYTALSKSVKVNASPSSKPPAGSLVPCAKCEKQFTVTKYTMAAVPGPGFLCHPCVKSSGIDPFKKPAAPRKRVKIADKRSVTYFEERRFPALISMCIDIISKHIDDIESFGDIGALNMEAISKAISKSRRLNSENVHLFYGPENTTLTLYDSTKLTPNALMTLGHLNPNLTTLRLDYCGLISDAVLESWSTSLPNLVSLQLLGPFLVRPPAWISFFKSHPQLQSFLITQSPRFDLECIRALAETSASSLKRLGLREVGQMSDDFLECIGTLFSQLTYLDIAEPAISCGDEAIVDLLAVIGHTLTHLDLSGHIALTDDVLESGIKPNVKSLSELVLSNLPSITDEGVSSFFSTWASNPPLTVVDLSRNPSLSSNSLISLLDHSGLCLQELNINGWKDVEGSALANISQQARELRKIDLGWCREVDDFIIKDLLNDCKVWLKEVKLWGCNRVEGKWFANGVRTKAKIFGVESQAFY